MDEHDGAPRADALRFVREHTVRAPVPLVPEIALRTATEVTPLWHATEAWLLLKLIAQNALTLHAQTRCAPIARWATPSLRAALLQIPGRLVRSARQLTLKLALRPLLTGASEHASSTPLRE